MNALLVSHSILGQHNVDPPYRDNAQQLAEWLSQRPDVSWVSYAGLPSHPSHRLAKKYLKHGYGGVLTFGVKGGLSAAKSFIENVKFRPTDINNVIIMSAKLHYIKCNVYWIPQHSFNVHYTL